MITRFTGNKELLLKLLVLLTISFLYLARAFNGFDEPFDEGDAPEYILTTEAITNHLTPDIRLNDLQSFKNKISTRFGWNNYYNRDGFAIYLNALQNDHFSFKQAVNTIFKAKNKKWYTQHFSFYSYINAPLYKFMSHRNPMRAFIVMNAIFVIIVCFFILFKTPLSIYNSILAALCFCFGAAYWYLGWEHTEVFTMCLVAIGMIYFLNKKYYTGLIFIALACLQNQPLSLLFGFLALVTLIEKRLTIQNFARVFAIGCITLLPSLFYYYHYATTNLIKDAGFLDTKYVTLNRVTGFYFDVNQGMILTIPLILLCYIVFIGREYFQIIKQRKITDYMVFLPFVLLAITASVSTMGNWNHGMAIINRYATWLSIVVMIHTFYLCNKMRETPSLVLFNYLFCFQCFTTLYHQQFNDHDWSSARNTPLAKWFYRYHPDLYNPDPVIFAGRLRIELMEEKSPIIYFKDRVARKMLVHRNQLDSLKNFGITKESLEKIRNSITYHYDWGYINMKLFKSSFSNQQIYEVIRKRRLEAVKLKILGSPTWSQQVREKAVGWGKTFDESVNIDAEYIVSEEERLRIDD